MAFVYHIHRPEDSGCFSEGYIGFTSGTVANRWQEHKEESRRERCAHYPLYKAMRKYSDLVITTLVAGDNDYCLDLEFRLRPDQRIGWNICAGGEKGSLGRKHSEETKLKISLAGTGKVKTDGTKAKIANALKGKRRTQETKELMSKNASNRTPEHREKLNLAHSNISDETRKKMSESRSNLYIECPWNNPQANKTSWFLASDIQSNFNAGKGPVVSSRDFGLLEHQIRTVLRKIKSGWNPENDHAYQSWLAQYKEQYETSLVI